MATKLPSDKRWFIFCEPCSYKHIIEAEDASECGLPEVKTAKVPGGSPRIDPGTKKTKIRPAIPQLKKFKCPKCGRGVVAKKLPEVYAKAYKEVDEEKKKRDAEIEKKKRLEDGKPITRSKEDGDFLG